MNPGVAVSDTPVWVRELQNFNACISDCLNNSQWDRLSEFLDARRSYMETLSTAAETFSADDKLALKQILQTILDQDANAVAMIEAQKAQSADQQSTLGQGLKAIQFYQSY